MRILIVEDNERLAQNIKEYLEIDKYTAEFCMDGEKALRKALVNEYDLLILDWNLPGMSGIELCRSYRERGKKTPILMLTSRVNVDDKVEGLDTGADDYLTKPFSFEELSARIRVLLRRSSSDKATKIKIKDIEIDLISKSVSRSNAIIALSKKEFLMLEYLAHNRGKTCNRTQILDHVWGDLGEDLQFDSDTVEVHIAYLRKKLGKDIIETKRGFGYIIE